MGIEILVFEIFMRGEVVTVGMDESHDAIVVDSEVSVCM